MGHGIRIVKNEKNYLSIDDCIAVCDGGCCCATDEFDFRTVSYCPYYKNCIEQAQSKTVTAIVERDVRDTNGETVLIRRGTPVEMSIVAKKAKGVGKGGMIDLTCISTTAVDGQSVVLLGGLNVQGDDNKGAALGCGLGLGLTFLFPFGFFFLCLKGENVEVPANTLIQNVVVNDNYIIKAE